jgi:hypothetical protein
MPFKTHGTVLLLERINSGDSLRLFLHFCIGIYLIKLKAQKLYNYEEKKNYTNIEPPFSLFSLNLFSSLDL